MSLQADYNLLRRAIGRFADSGRSDSDWDTTQTLDIADCLANGERMFYWPDLNGDIYRWSFLEESLSITFVDGKTSYPLPPEFSSLKDRFVYTSGGSGCLAEASDTELLTLIASEARQGPPEYFAISSRPSAPGDRSLREVLVYPIPNADATVRGTMQIEPMPMSADNPYPRGGAVHAETIKEACLAAAEQLFFPESGPGIHAEAFQRCLAKSIEEDRRLTNDGINDVWPLDPLDAGLKTLEVNKFYLLRVIGEAMEFGPHPKTWKPNEAAKAKELLRTALRDFYNPQQFHHVWSFLSPTCKITLEDGKYIYDLPAEWGGIRGRISYAPNTDNQFPEIVFTNQHSVEELLQISTDAFYAPTEAFARIKEPVAGAGTRWELVIAPPPSGAYEILIPFAINPYQLDDDADLPLGGQPHAQTLIESALAAAEVAKGEPGIHQQRFFERLQTSIAYDQEASCARTLGISQERSDNVSHEILFGDYYYMDNHLTAYDNS